MEISNGRKFFSLKEVSNMLDYEEILLYSKISSNHLHLLKDDYDYFYNYNKNGYEHVYAHISEKLINYLKYILCNNHDKKIYDDYVEIEKLIKDKDQLDYHKKDYFGKSYYCNKCSSEINNIKELIICAEDKIKNKDVKILFGKYKNLTLKDVPDDYLNWARLTSMMRAHDYK